jgi:hypothetical protein
MPGTMTFEQVLQQSNDFKAAADEVARFHLANFQNLSDEEHGKLHEKEDDLRDKSRRLLTDATTIVWQDLQGALKHVREATDKMRAVRAHLKTVKRTLSFAAGAIVLGGAVLAGNPVAVGTASLKLIDLVNGFRDEDDQEAEDEAEALG